MEWLRGEGYSVRAAAPGEAGSPADLVIVDVYKPRHEGAARLRAIKAAHPQVPVIAISGQFRQIAQLAVVGGDDVPIRTPGIVSGRTRKHDDDQQADDDDPESQARRARCVREQ